MVLPWFIFQYCRQLNIYEYINSEQLDTVLYTKTGFLKIYLGLLTLCTGSESTRTP